MGWGISDNSLIQGAICIPNRLIREDRSWHIQLSVLGTSLTLIPIHEEAT